MVFRRRRLTQGEGDLSDHPVVGLVDADTPDDEADGGEESGGVGEPEAHLGGLYTAVTLGESDDEPVAEPAGEEDLGDQGAGDETDEEEAANISARYYPIS